jgi:uroporphyrin-III C-methyltransferase
VTTNGQGCRLAGRLKREVVARMPKDAAGAVQKVGELRRMSRASTTTTTNNKEDYFSPAIANGGEQEDSFEDSGVATLNRPVPIRSISQVESEEEAARRRMKWVAQVSEYWPLSKLAGLTAEETKMVLSGDLSATPPASSTGPAVAAQTLPSIHSLTLPPPQDAYTSSAPGPVTPPS